jgi:DNA-binding protein H-NS
MAKPNLSKMSVGDLMDLREQVNAHLLKHRAELQQQFDRLDGAVALLDGPRAKGRASALQGRKVPPKYRGPSGETWAGRGMKPKWLVAAMKDGKKLDHFLIDKSARKGR